VSHFKVTSFEKVDLGFWVLGGKHSDAWTQFIEIYLAHLVFKIFLPEIYMRKSKNSVHFENLSADGRGERAQKSFEVQESKHLKASTRAENLAFNF